MNIDKGCFGLNCYQLQSRVILLRRTQVVEGWGITAISDQVFSAS
ncbi:hypothetical protein SR1949_20550 [Sphaerospermopsis reniformis]|uniref:Uncharacterized protein n=1 Tax=Sphaerospermopsis reniformis TaxID=531300 RepID=A0A479ZW83_9CYAN|nr:hypothetical protein SR1949_20550 [Sphaerospermopsis reniformis]